MIAERLFPLQVKRAYVEDSGLVAGLATMAHTAHALLEPGTGNADPEYEPPDSAVNRWIVLMRLFRHLVYRRSVGPQTWVPEQGAALILYC